MAETLFEELKRYVGFGPADEAALQRLHPMVQPEFERIAQIFYQRILDHDGARQVLVGSKVQADKLTVTLVGWMDKLLTGPWDEEYYQLRCRIGRVHVRIGLPQHYMLGAMNVLREEVGGVLRSAFRDRIELLGPHRIALDRILDLELAVMLHTYREDLLSQQARSERLATFGQLVGSIGHELRNPLGVIETSLHILKGRLGEDQKTRKHAERIGEQVGIANGIVTDLLDMIRDRPLAHDQVRLGALVEGAAASIRCPEGVVITFDGLQGLPPVSGDDGQLRQVLVNLLDNAVHAAGPRGEVRVLGARDGGFVRVAVEDSGPGVDAATLRRLFEPLVTTKAKGIGLGLALVKRIVERHQGSVAYEPGPGGGARFVLRLPVAQE